MYKLQCFNTLLNVFLLHFFLCFFSSVAKRFEDEYGVARLSIGEAMRTILTTQPQSELAKLMNKALLRGFTVPEELQIQALETVMLDMRVQTRGYVQSCP
jgi:adenylate/nucleoside-diphosphate kinase